MKVQSVSQTGAGSSNPFVMNTNSTTFNIGFGVVVNGIVNYTVQHTFDDPAVGFTNWFNNSTVASQTANASGSYNFPVTGVRLTVNSGNGAATLNLIQSGIV